MSASTEKKIRAQARAEGTDKKTIQAQEEAAKKAKTRKKYLIAIIAAVFFIVITLVLNSNALYRNTTAVSVGDNKFSPADLNYEYASSYYDFLNTYGDYASLFGLDTSNGAIGLNSQECSMLEEGGTWRDYFVQQAIEKLKEICGLCKYAGENGIALDEDELSEIDAMFTGLDESAKAYGYPSGNKYLSANFGKGVNADIAKNIETQLERATKVYNTLIDEAAEADTDFEDYDMINVRHILIKAVADDDGNYTEEAMAEAKAKAEEILAEYEAGDKTEDSFAELANKWSEDTGSNTNGGFYMDVYKGQMVEEFEEWCFDSARKPGDTGIVHGESTSYNGYHVMYFSGTGDAYSVSSARRSELADMIADKMSELTESQEVKTTAFCNFVGKN